MTSDPFRLAQLLCARLCHDLAGPVGGAAAGAELLADEGDGSEAAQLLAGAVDAAARRLKFFRAAFGQGGVPADAAGLRDLVAGLLAGAPSVSAVTLDWDVGDSAVAGGWDGDKGKLVLNLALLGRDALPRGGQLAVRLAGGAGWRVSVEARGQGAASGDGGVGLAAASADGLGPRAAQGYYAARLADSVGARVTVRSQPGRVEIETEAQGP